MLTETSARGKATRPADKMLGKDAARTRQRILAAATIEFAHAGFAGTRVDRIAREAGVNVRMLYYYFGSKDDLFRRVLEQAYAELRSAESSLDLDHAEPREAVRQLIALAFGYLRSNPEFVSLLNTENMLKGVHLQEPGEGDGLHAPLLALVRRVLARGVDAGVFRADVDAAQLYLTIASLCYFYFSNHYTLSVMFQADLMTDESVKGRLSHITEVVLGYMRPAVEST